ncbi:MAG: flagellin, partial [Candidatus Eiseniibacteriota bacterium]
QSGNSSAVAAAVTNLSATEQQTLVFQSEAGARIQSIQTMTDQLGQRTQQMLDRRSALSDADPTESVLQVTNQQNALERAYAVVGRVLSTNLLDYLR